MKKLIFLLISTIGFSQSGNLENIYNPNFVPPSPEAFSFTKIAELPVNESSGNASVDIPLITFEAGKLKLPISISHNGSAVRVDDDNTWTGIGWQLNAAGLITRTVNDKADEMMGTGERLHPTGSVSQETLYTICNSSLDSEVDIFNYNFNGYSGSFYFDTDMIARQIKYENELKIEISNNPIVNGVTTFNKRTITITIPDGTKYSFGGLDASESTKIRLGPGNFTDMLQSSFYLYKIENIRGDIININYLVNGFASIRKIGYNQELVKDETIEGISTCSPSLTTNPNLSAPKPYYMQSSGYLRLNTISSNIDNSRIVFESTPSFDDTFGHKLDYIKLYDYKSLLYKKIKFDYSCPSVVGNDNNYPDDNVTFYKRFFLGSIKIYQKNNSSTEEVYTFEYNDYDKLPRRFSFSQDYAGYYNGKLNNKSYVSNIPTYIQVGNAAMLNLLADKTVNFNTTCYGSLKKVTYPTKGYTEFNYETYSELVNIPLLKQDKFVTVYYKDPNRNYTTLFSSEVFVNPPVLMDPDSTNPQSTSNTLSNGDFMATFPIMVSINVNVTGASTQHNYVLVKLIDVNTNNSFQEIIQIPSATGSGIVNYNYDVPFNNLSPNANYKVYLQYYSTSSIYPQSVVVNAQIKYYVVDFQNVYRPGIRIKRIKQYANNLDTPLVTRYYYNMLSKALLQTGTDSQVEVRMPNFIGLRRIVSACSAFNGLGTYCYPFTIEKKVIYSNPQNNIYLSDLNRNVYEYVTVSYGGDNFEKGGKQSKFFAQGDLPNSPYSISGEYVSVSKYSNNSLKNGTLLNEIIFKNGATFDSSTNVITSGKIKETTNTYLNLAEKSHSINNWYASKFCETPICIVGNWNNYTDNYYIGRYSIFSWWHTLESTITKEYFDTGIIETIQNYNYNGDSVKLAGLPSSTITTVGTDTIETKYHYPLFSSMSSQPNISNLINDYVIGSPLTKEVFKNGSKISEEKTQFNADSYPQYIYAAKFPNSLPNISNVGNLEKRITFNSYDNKGNFTQYTLENGNPVSVIWGFNNTKVVAKLENIAYNQIPTNLVNDIHNITNNPNSSQGQINSALDALRTSSDTNLQLALITTFNYDSLRGISVITDPKGDKQTYHYDSFNRLQFVKDAQGNILSENDYHFKD